MIVELVKEFRFESAHRLPNVPAEHKCARLHGHSFVCEVSVRGEVNPDAVTLKLKQTAMRGGLVELPAGGESRCDLADHPA